MAIFIPLTQIHHSGEKRSFFVNMDLIEVVIAYGEGAVLMLPGGDELKVYESVAQIMKRVNAKRAK